MTRRQREFAQLYELAREHGANLVPLVRTISADTLTPVTAFLRLAAKEEECFLFESVEGGEHVGRYTFLGIRPFQVATFSDHAVTIQRGRKRQVLRGPILETLAGLFAKHRLL